MLIFQNFIINSKSKRRDQIGMKITPPFIFLSWKNREKILLEKQISSILRYFDFVFFICEHGKKQ